MDFYQFLGGGGRLRFLTSPKQNILAKVQRKKATKNYCFEN